MPSREIGDISTIAYHPTTTGRAATALQARSLQQAILTSASFSSIATDGHGVIQIFNVGAERMLGYAAAEVINRVTPADLSDPQELRDRAATLSAEFDTPIAPGFQALVCKAIRDIEDIYELTYIRKDGSRLPAVVSVTALRDAQDAIIGYLLIGTDNTARRQANDALRLAAIVDSADDGVITTDLDGTITSWNRASERLFGYPASAMVGQSIHRLIPDHLQHEEIRVLDAIRGGERLEHYETVGRCQDDRLIPLSLTVSPIRNTDGTVIGSSKIIRDISERLRAEGDIRSLQLEQDRFFSLSIDMLCIASIDGYFKRVSLALDQLLGYTADEFMVHPLIHYVHADDVASTTAEIAKLAAGATSIAFENRFRCKDGSYKWLSWRSALDSGGLFYAIARDVTGERASRDRLLASLAEKDVLVKEIHHRVKNNMQVVSSLLNLQANSSDNPEVRALLWESQARVYAMAVVHEALHDSGNLAAVDFATLTQKLWTYLMATYTQTGAAIRFQSDVDVPPLAIDLAVPCALIVTEILSNALKHAFSEAGRGSVFLQFRSAPNQPGVLRLQITDDGRGFTDDERTRAEARGSIGHKIVGALAEQLGATIVYSPGTTFTMTFPSDEQETRA